MKQMRKRLEMRIEQESCGLRVMPRLRTGESEELKVSLEELVYIGEWKGR